MAFHGGIQKHRSHLNIVPDNSIAPSTAEQHSLPLLCQNTTWSCTGTVNDRLPDRL